MLRRRWWGIGIGRVRLEGCAVFDMAGREKEVGEGVEGCSGIGSMV